MKKNKDKKNALSIAVNDSTWKFYKLVHNIPQADKQSESSIKTFHNYKNKNQWFPYSNSAFEQISIGNNYTAWAIKVECSKPNNKGETISFADSLAIIDGVIYEEYSKNKLDEAIEMAKPIIFIEFEGNVSFSRIPKEINIYNSFGEKIWTTIPEKDNFDLPKIDEYYIIEYIYEDQIIKSSKPESISD